MERSRPLAKVDGRGLWWRYRYPSLHVARPTKTKVQQRKALVKIVLIISGNRCRLTTQTLATVWDMARGGKRCPLEKQPLPERTTHSRHMVKLQANSIVLSTDQMNDCPGLASPFPFWESGWICFPGLDCAMAVVLARLVGRLS